MDIATLTAELRKKILTYTTESDKYAEQVNRGNDIFESSRAQSFSDGAAEALTETLRQLQEIQDTQQSVLEWGESSEQKPWESGILS
jgi:hypothetical protein